MQFYRKKYFGRQLYDFFDKIYCINLDDRPDRWRYVRKQFDKFGLKGKVERFSAVDVRKDPSLHKYEKLLKDNWSLLAMCGCSLSHRKIIEIAKRNGLNNVLVFEDDVKFLKHNLNHIDKSLLDLSNFRWDVFYLGATYHKKLKSVSPYLVNAPEGAFATHAIAYNRSVFDQILDVIPSEPIQYLQSVKLEINAVDNWLQSDFFEHKHFFGTNPIMVVQGLQESDIAFNQKDGIEEAQIKLFWKNVQH